MMRRLALLLFVTLAHCAKKTVPGCPDVDVLESETEIDQKTLSNLLLCFCKVTKKDDVSVSCLYGSNPEHLERAAEAVRNASLAIKEISIQHMEFTDEGLPSLSELAPELESIEIRECSTLDPLPVRDNVFSGLEGKLRNLTIHGCHLMEVPKALAPLSSLRNFDLSGNKLQTLPKDIFSNKKELQYLDVSANEISYLAENTFEKLDNLHTLVIGDRNYMNETVLEEIGKLKSLKVLDLSKADGVFEPPNEAFSSLVDLETLKLSGCSIAALEPGSFSTLKNLKNLDLRVNLIENVTAYAFDGLNNLEKLTLAGNYIRNLESDVWAGLSKLKELDIGWNEIKEIPDKIFAPLAENLRTLNIRHNPLKQLQSTGLNNLEELVVGECEFKEFTTDSLKDYPVLQVLDISKCNLTEIPDDLFVGQAKTLRKLHMEKNRITSIPAKPIKDLESLQELDVSGNPFLCDTKMVDFIFEIEDRYKNAARDGKDFLLANGNETLCDRPYSLRDQALLALDTHELQPYDASVDTTTISTTTTTESSEEETTTQFKIGDLFVGSKTNDTLFKEEPRKALYDLHDDSKLQEVDKQDSGMALPLTVVVIAAVSVISIVAVALFIRKRKKSEVTPTPAKSPPKTNPEDEMVEIELESTKH